MKANERNIITVERIMAIVEDGHREVMTLEADVREALAKHDSFTDSGQVAPIFWARVAERKLKELNMLLDEHAKRVARAHDELQTLIGKVKVN